MSRFGFLTQQADRGRIRVGLLSGFLGLQDAVASACAAGNRV